MYQAACLILESEPIKVSPNVLIFSKMWLIFTHSMRLVTIWYMCWWSANMAKCYIIPVWYMPLCASASECWTRPPAQTDMSQLRAVLVATSLHSFDVVVWYKPVIGTSVACGTYILEFTIRNDLIYPIRHPTTNPHSTISKWRYFIVAFLELT